jgi:hypothetical protein
MGTYDDWKGRSDMDEYPYDELDQPAIEHRGSKRLIADLMSDPEQVQAIKDEARRRIAYDVMLDALRKVLLYHEGTDALGYDDAGEAVYQAVVMAIDAGEGSE